MKLGDVVNRWALTINSATNYATTAIGAAVVPANNAYSAAWVQLINGSTAWPTDSGDAYQIEILVTNGMTSGAARDILVKLGIDLAGGTSYTDWISDLVCGPAASRTSGKTGVWYIFPIRVPRGASIGAKTSVNNATVGTVSVACRLRCKPTHPELIRVGKYVRTFGVDTATSAGTAHTPGGSGTKSTWAQVGSAVAADDDLWWWQLGVGQNNAAMNNNGMAWDLGIGDASNKAIIIDDVYVGGDTGEALIREIHGAYYQAKPGDLIYVRASSGGAAASGMSAAAYAVGG